MAYVKKSDDAYWGTCSLILEDTARLFEEGMRKVVPRGSGSAHGGPFQRRRAGKRREKKCAITIHVSRRGSLKFMACEDGSRRVNLTAPSSPAAPAPLPATAAPLPDVNDRSFPFPLAAIVVCTFYLPHFPAKNEMLCCTSNC